MLPVTCAGHDRVNIGSRIATLGSIVSCRIEALLPLMGHFNTAFLVTSEPVPLKEDNTIWGGEGEIII